MPRGKWSYRLFYLVLVEERYFVFNAIHITGFFYVTKFSNVTLYGTASYFFCVLSNFYSYLVVNLVFLAHFFLPQICIYISQSILKGSCVLSLHRVIRYVTTVGAV